MGVDVSVSGDCPSVELAPVGAVAINRRPLRELRKIVHRYAAVVR